MSTYQLFFGRNIPSGGYVNDDNWNSFQTIISETFDGFTVWDCIGYYKGEKENTKVVSISTDDYESIVNVCNQYKQIFSQECVGVNQLPEMSFV